MKNKKVFSNFRLSQTAIMVMVTLVVVFVFGAFTPTFGQALDTGLEYGELTGLGNEDIRVIVMRIVQVALGVIGIIAFLIILYAGFLWTTSAGNEEKIDTAKRTLRNAVIGLAIIFLSFAIVSFVINSLRSALGGDGQGGPGGPGSVPTGELGNGVIESVYPTPFSKNVFRTTNVMTTFKVRMEPGSIIVGAPNDPNACTGGVDNPCQGVLRDESVKIYRRDQGIEQSLDGADVIAFTTDGRTYTFNPLGLLGDGVNDTGYSVTLTDEIAKDSGEPAFGGRFGSNFSWSFDIGTFADLDPVEISSVFPYPDDSTDNYSQTIGTQASTTMRVGIAPRAAQAARATVTKVTQNTPGTLTILGTYNAGYSGVVTVTINPANTNQATLTWDVPPATTFNFPQGTVSITNGTIVVGGGISFVVANQQAGEQWRVQLVAAQSSDTFTIAGRQYTFVSQSPNAQQIEITANLPVLAQRIADKIGTDFSSRFETSVNGLIITVRSKKAGAEYNNTTFSSSGTWLSPSSGQFSGGSNSDLAAQVRSSVDQPRNTVIKIDFNEPIDPTSVTPETIVVQYDSDANPNSENWQTVSGRYFVSNQYQTVEFLSNSQCGTCSNNGQACSDDSQCGGGTCGFVSNSCGEQIYCLPVLADGNSATTAYDATNYRVMVKAGLLADCSSGTCSESNYSACVQTPGSDAGSVCANLSTYEAAGNYFHPEARSGNTGIVDVSRNSLNGNRNTYTIGSQVLGNAQGPSEQTNLSAFNLNAENAGTQGDDVIWSFYINKQIKITPPAITQVGPNVGAEAASLTLPVDMSFDTVMFGASLKPGSGYEDGYCGCRQDSDCGSNETCDLSRSLVGDGYGKCKNVNVAEQQYCAQDNQCGTNLCINKKYLTLIDLSTTPVGFWITHRGIDTLPQDGFADLSVGQIQHPPLAALSNYGAEIGSGIKDIYQNCYLPSNGPSGVQGRCSSSGVVCTADVDCSQPGERCEGIITASPTSSCNTTASAPYCCNGVALPQQGTCSGTNNPCVSTSDCQGGQTCSANWEASSCFTGY